MVFLLHDINKVHYKILGKSENLLKTRYTLQTFRNVAIIICKRFELEN